ncbi:uncharacterized protein [Cicer arietinum]|uniref:Uncharacterized protein LOC101503454 n=1 Tax=Cicer arietinum TaxID=3827 RepID=A0A1S2YUP0_CICAR|nr:uncharacterized protein LOC101503454 [Cicer arietinum]
MGDRKGDVRIYIISCFFFACTIGGGIFLSLYIFLPESESVTWHLIAGMILVAIPWISWFVIFLYRCIRPINVPFDEHRLNNGAIWTPKSSPAVTSPNGAKSPAHSPVGGGRERCVQFGPVVEMGNGFHGDDGEGEEHHHNEDFVDHHESKEEHEIPTLIMVEH